MSRARIGRRVKVAAWLACAWSIVRFVLDIAGFSGESSTIFGRMPAGLRIVAQILYLPMTGPVICLACLAAFYLLERSRAATKRTARGRRASPRSHPPVPVPRWVWGIGVPIGIMATVIATDRHVDWWNRHPNLQATPVWVVTRPLNAEQSATRVIALIRITNTGGRPSVVRSYSLGVRPSGSRGFIDGRQQSVPSTSPLLDPAGKSVGVIYGSQALYNTAMITPVPIGATSYGYVIYDFPMTPKREFDRDGTIVRITAVDVIGKSSDFDYPYDPDPNEAYFFPKP